MRRRRRREASWEAAPRARESRVVGGGAGAVGSVGEEAEAWGVRGKGRGERTAGLAVWAVESAAPRKADGLRVREAPRARARRLMLAEVMKQGCAVADVDMVARVCCGGDAELALCHGGEGAVGVAQGITQAGNEGGRCIHISDPPIRTPRTPSPRKFPPLNLPHLPHTPSERAHTCPRRIERRHIFNGESTGRQPTTRARIRKRFPPRAASSASEIFSTTLSPASAALRKPPSKDVNPHLQQHPPAAPRVPPVHRPSPVVAVHPPKQSNVRSPMITPPPRPHRATMPHHPPAFAAALPLSARQRPPSLSPAAKPSHRRATPPQRRTAPPCMTSAAHELRRRIASVQAAEKIVSALRIVAAARIRASSHAALRARPFAEELQHVLASLVHEIVRRDIDTEAVALSTATHELDAMHGVVLADPVVQKALLDRIYLALLHKPGDVAAEARRWGRGGAVTVLTVLTADKGFCGAYNKDIISRAVRRIKELADVGKKVELVLVGRTAGSFFARHHPNLPVRFSAPMGKSKDAEVTATMLSRILLSEFISGGVDRVEIIYTRFVSLISSTPSARTLLPLTPTGLEGVGDELFQLTLTTKNGRLTTKRQAVGNGVHGGHSLSQQNGRPQPVLEKNFGSFYNITDEDAIRLLNSMLPMYVTSQLIRIVREAIAAEQASRLAAMSAATENAREIVTALQSEYHKERQARITNEIIEVVTNANA